jgi:hypothetical protein
MYHNLKLNHSEHEKTLYHTQPLQSNYYMILHNGRKVKGKGKNGIGEQKPSRESGTKALQQLHNVPLYHNLKLNHSEHEKTLYHTQPLQSNYYMILHNGRKVKGKEKNGVSEQNQSHESGTKALQQYHYATADMHTLAANNQLNCHPLWKYVEILGGVIPAA